MTGKAEMISYKRARLMAERLRKANVSRLRPPAAAALRTPPCARVMGFKEGMEVSCQAGWYREAIRFVPVYGTERFLLRKED